MGQKVSVNKITILEEKIKKLEEEVAGIRKYITYMEVRGFGIDLAYDDAVKLLKGRSFITYNWLQRKLNIGYARTQHIIDKLEKEKLIGPKSNGLEKRKVLQPKN